MDMNFVNMGDFQKIMEDAPKMQQYCAEHFACEGCQIYKGEPLILGNTTFGCENMGKGKDASKV